MAAAKSLFNSVSHAGEAFPNVVSLDLQVIQDPNGYYTNKGGQNVSHFTLATLSRHIRCLNPRCQQGGLDIQNIVAFSNSGDYEFWCNGHEGTPKGRKVGDACDNRFNVILKVERIT